VLNVGTGFEKVSMEGVLELFELHADSISSQTGTFVSSLKVQGELLVGRIKNYIAEKITFENIALFTLRVIARFTKFEESDESQIEMANLNNQSIISLDINSIKFFGLHTTSAGHVFTGVVTSDKTTWIA